VARDYDTQLLESVAVRRRRLRDAILLGAVHARRTINDNLRRAAVGVLIAAVLCAGCVGWSFLADQLAQRQQEAQQRQAELGRAGVGP
jgi:uncharacterized protein HemX